MKPSLSDLADHLEILGSFVQTATRNYQELILLEGFLGSTRVQGWREQALLVLNAAQSAFDNAAEEAGRADAESRLWTWSRRWERLRPWEGLAFDKWVEWIRYPAPYGTLWNPEYKPDQERKVEG